MSGCSSNDLRPSSASGDAGTNCWRISGRGIVNGPARKQHQVGKPRVVFEAWTKPRAIQTMVGTEVRVDAIRRTWTRSVAVDDTPVACEAADLTNAANLGLT